MKYALIVLAITMVARTAMAAPPAYTPQEGDVLFQSLPHSDLVDAIEGVSHSRYSHVGLLIRKDHAWFVREAIGPVRDTPLPDWIARGRGTKGQAFDAYRLRAPLQAIIPRLISATEPFMGKPYDFRYRLDDEAIYCSELVYKAMLSATGLRLGNLQQLGALDWKPYRATIEKYEEGRAPLDRLMITPRGMSEAHALEVVYRGLTEH